MMTLFSFGSLVFKWARGFDSIVDICLPYRSYLTFIGFSCSFGGEVFDPVRLDSLPLTIVCRRLNWAGVFDGETPFDDFDAA